MQRTDRDPDAYIASLPAADRETITLLDKLISKTLHTHERVMWEGVLWGGTQQKIIGYGHFTYIGRSHGAKPAEWLFVGLAQQKDHISLYLNAYLKGESLAKSQGKMLGPKVKVSAGVITFRKISDIDLDKLTELLEMAKGLHIAGVIKA